MSCLENVPSCFLLVITWPPPIYILRCICQGCLNKVPPTGWLKTRGRYWLPVLESSGLRSQCQQGWFPLKAVRKKPPPASLFASGGLLAICSLPWLVDDCLLVCLPKVFFLRVCVCLHRSPFYKDTGEIRLGVHPTSAWPHLNWLHLYQLCFQLRSHPEAPGFRTSTHEFTGDDTVQPVMSLHKADSLHIFWSPPKMAQSLL